MSNIIAYTIFYILFVAGIVYPPQEFVSVGLTISEVFSSWLGNESTAFVQYHIKRSIITFLIHSLLPFVYIIGLTLLGYIDTVQLLIGTEHSLWLTLSLCALVGPLYTLARIINWSRNDWSQHPIAKKLAIYCDNDNKSWIDVASNVNIEFQSLTKLQIATNTVTKVVVTDNWIIQVSSYNLDIANQTSTKLVCFKVNTYTNPSSTIEDIGSTYVKYRVCTTQPGGKNFTLRLNYNDVENFTGKVTMEIVTMPKCEFPKRLRELCIDWIKEEITKNPIYFTNEELEKCAVCINATSDIKLVKRCPDIPAVDNNPACRPCNCPPRLCIDCLVKWFITTSIDLTKPIENLVQIKSSCPHCRSTFCLTDVSYVAYDPYYNTSGSSSTDNKS
ncbi:E3 ubiquitin-protein ligase TM129 [Cotesia glomerata]|uniref:E3 ubiquitin-protein ligase TM129 n=1 Tax=Cotesia glomerata TaxID=32391 RepID=UPI001D018A9B|nr:E3 ubiquitin-protein ligase TM129 [Cotesia glomerata]